jgi:hypothetical protein
MILSPCGRDRMQARFRVVPSNSDEDNSYDEFMWRSAKIVMRENAVEGLKIMRRRHFIGTGKHRRTDNEVDLFSWKDEEPANVLGLRRSRKNREASYRREIARELIPFHLTEFFLFNGDRVQQFALKQRVKMIKNELEVMRRVRLLCVHPAHPAPVPVPCQRIKAW